MPPPPASRRVLVVDEGPAYRQWACRLLREESLVTEEAADGRQALQLIRRRSYDLVVLDLLLSSNPTGVQVLDQLQKDPQTSCIPVVTMTGSGGRAAGIEALALGAASAIPKTLPHIFVPTITQVLELSGKGRLPRGADVLHVEDDEQWAALARLWLEERGLIVHHVTGGGELDHYLRYCRRLPRCLLMDLSLEGEDGLALCGRLKASPALQHLPIVVLSGRPMNPLESLKRQAVYHVAKGAGTREELAAVLKSILTQLEHTEGVIDAGDLRLDAREGAILLAGRLVARLKPGPFSAFAALVPAAPEPVSESALYRSFLSRHAYRQADPELTSRQTVRTYVSQLRRSLGSLLGARIVSTKAGYRYLPRSR